MKSFTPLRQTKHVGNVVLHLLSVKSLPFLTVKLQAFLPQPDAINASVLCDGLAGVLVALRSVVDTAEKILNSNDMLSEEDIQLAMEACELLKVTSISKVSRSLSRVAATAGMKVLLLTVQEAHAKIDIDRAAKQKAKAAHDLVYQVARYVDSRTEAKTESFDAVIGDFQNLQLVMESLAALPAAVESTHANVRSQLQTMKKTLEDRNKLKNKRMICFVF